MTAEKGRTSSLTAAHLKLPVAGLFPAADLLALGLSLSERKGP
jgi:hypothetical protein